MKQKIQSLLGERRYAYLRACVVWLKGINVPKLKSSIQYKVFGDRNHNCFFGYYDIQQFSRDEKKILAHRVGANAEPLRDDAELGYYEIESGKFVPLIRTKAWCWQQGARLRWHPASPTRILYNDIEDDCYVCREYDIEEKKIVRTYNRALYDISSDFKYGLSLDYSRLQRLRPGYGYGRLEDQSSQEKIPREGGIYKVDLQTGKEQLLISYKRLAEGYNATSTENHYINHISISPDGSRFMFFYIISDEKNERWKTRLFVADENGLECRLIEDKYVVSHYCWKNSHTLLVTAIYEGKTFYEVIDLNTMNRERIVADKLTRDGHPTYLNHNEFIITDTYPNQKSVQTVLCVNVHTGVVTTQASVKHYPFLFGEKRCDLHPRVSKSNSLFAVDTLHKGNLRNIIVFQVPNDNQTMITR